VSRAFIVFLHEHSLGFTGSLQSFLT